VSPCLDEATVVALFAGDLAEETRERILRHVEACSACRELVVALSEDAAFQPTVPALEPTASDGAVFGGYVLLRAIGEGGVGVVHEAREAASGRTFALKVLKDHDPSHVARFRREAQVGATLRHPHIAGVHDVVVHDDRIGIVSPLLRGESLDRRLARELRLSFAAACSVLAPLARALAFAHEAGVVHRDVKPQNVFLEGDPRGPIEATRVVLLDFGLAKAIGHEAQLAMATRLTDTGMVVGTPHYMSPEQITGSTDLTSAVDAWSLGVVAYECLAGTRPVEGRSFGQIFKRLTQERIVPLRERVPSLPPELLGLVDALLSPEPALRPPLAEVARALAAHVG
jgi:serine/threonine protein kinase